MSGYQEDSEANGGKEGSSWLDIMTLNEFVKMITIVANHEDVWNQEEWIARLEDEEEKEKYEYYKEIDDESERLKYTPKKSKFTVGRGGKRKFGVSLWNQEGKDLELSLLRVWRDAFRKKDVRDWISQAWEKWVVDKKFCRHWKKKTVKEICEDDIEESDDNDETGVELILEGDDGFESCMAGMRGDNNDNGEGESFVNGGSLFESFQSNDDDTEEAPEMGVDSNDEYDMEGDKCGDSEHECEQTEPVYTVTNRKKKKTKVGIRGKRKSTRRMVGV